MDVHSIQSGIPIVGEVPWGTHLCQFYQSNDDLLETLVPFFVAGLKGNERCLWIVSGALDQETAERALRERVPDFDRRRAARDITILAARTAYSSDGRFDGDGVIATWEAELAAALRDGYGGLRLSGDPTSVESADWTTLSDYEKRLNGVVQSRPITILCTYPLNRTGAAEVLDVVRSHQFAIARQGTQWDLVETARPALSMSPAARLNEELEERVAERTAELTAANARLRHEVADRQRAEEEVDRLRRQLELENAYLQEHMKERLAFGEIVGASRSLRRVLDQIQMVAPTDASVLISGESGTGKELAARAIHDASPRRDRPMVIVNYASIPRELFESEFFGHVRGAFTGAIRDRIGRFQLADRGTIFLDEVGEIPIEAQPKLLRALQEGQVERIGEDRVRQVDIRVIAATNHDLKREVEAGRFRRDLYYRLCVFPLQVPPLRERREDIPPLATHFLRIAARRLNRPAVRLTEEGMAALTRYDWPGNVRELHHVIERAVIVSPGGPLRIDVILAETNRPESDEAERVVDPGGAVLPRTELARQERENLVAALRLTGWRVYGIGGAAALLGMKPTTLASRLKRLGIQRPH